jgi:hypothetical protein
MEVNVSWELSYIGRRTDNNGPMLKTFAWNRGYIGKTLENGIPGVIGHFDALSD